MAKLVFEQAFEMTANNFSQFVNGQITGATSTEIDVQSGDYTAQILGEDFNPLTGQGTVHEVHAQFQGDALFDITGLNVPFSQLEQDQQNPDALIEDIFGGNDKIKGSAGADHLLGYNGDDKLIGGAGADTLEGGAGKDKMEGGAHTTFVFNEGDSGATGATADLITDLQDTDTLDLSSLGADHVTAKYDSKHDVTLFSVYANADDKHAEMVISASGDHHTFDGFSL